MVTAKDIRRRFGSHQALKGISFTLSDGEIIAVMGANGAGKSTLFDILATLDDRYDGTVEVDGANLRRHKKSIRPKIGYVPGKFSLYPDLTLEENLDFFASAYDASPSDIETQSPLLWESLKPFSTYRADRLSGGMKKKLSLCCAMVHAPSILLLDEPTVGIDPLSRKDVWNELKNLREKGVSILISTHYLDEATLADKVLFMHEGSVLLFDTPERILDTYRYTLIEIGISGETDNAALEKLRTILATTSCVLDCYAWGNYLHAVAESEQRVEEIAGTCRREYGAMISVKTIRPTLEDVFMDTLSQTKNQT
ncbi:MAG: ABC transporter ATP-binding protein [Bacteroidales bacterium]|nr:ABC transporter ATP-binding protein [Bacteroidota bacterium]NLN99832.1 ABC transporter ATP-binding protein [Bacteroidales bacterium]